MVFALITRLLQGEAGIFLTRLKRVFGLYVMLVVFGLMTLFLLISTLFIWSSQHFGSLNTAIAFTAVMFVLSLLTFVMIKLAGRQPEKRADDRLQRDIVSIAGVTAMTNAPQIMRAVRRQKKLLLVPIAGMGFLALYKLLAHRRNQ